MKTTIKTLAVAALFFAATKTLQAQTIPNAGFENWTSMGSYSDPDGWATMNMATNLGSVYTAEKGTPGNVGNSYLKLTSKAVVGMGVVNGMATSGSFDPTTMQPKSGFACNGRPAKLTGKWQHMIYGNSQGFIDVKLTRWDANSKSRIPVATGTVTLSGMAMSWATFTINLNYVDNANPDTCMITLAASGSNPTADDYLWIDALAFTGTVSGINDAKLNTINVNVAPNPSNSFWDITVNDAKSNISAKLFNVLGEEIVIENPLFNDNDIHLNINNSNLANGIYFLHLTNGNTNKTVQLIKN